jgi:hypothetical protein
MLILYGFTGNIHGLINTSDRKSVPVRREWEMETFDILVRKRQQVSFQREREDMVKVAGPQIAEASPKYDNESITPVI